jgi:hypothetical protein
MSTTLWVHGNAAQVQYPTELTDIAYTGHGLTATIAAHKSGWIHIPIPSPEIESVPRLTEVIGNFSISDGHMDELSIYDGGNRIHHESGLDGDSYLHIQLTSPHDVSEGIGLSLHFEYGGDPSIDNLAQTITITSAAGVYDFKIVATKSANPPAAAKQQIGLNP